MTSDWRPTTPALNASTLNATLRENAVVAIHVWATWAHVLDRQLDEALRPLREEFKGHVAFRSVEWDSAFGARFIGDTNGLTVPSLSIWIRGRFWHNLGGAAPTDRLRAGLAEAVRRSAARSENLEVFVRESDLARIARWGENLLGGLSLVHEDPDQTVYHSASGRAFSLTPRMEDTDFTSVWISPTTDGVPFAADVELARAAFQALGVEARCCPEDVGRHVTPNQWWSVSGNGERKIELWVPTDLVDQIAFDALFEAIGAGPRTGLLWQIVSRYSEPHRTYHNLLHICEAYGALVECGSRVERRQEAELALWFHDAIYDTRRHDNEEGSADWARDELLAAGAGPDVAARVHALVLATKHRVVPEGNDARLLIDADLSILASPPDRFAAYERQIRKEYDWVPGPEFRAAREKFLRGMLARPSIFNDPAMRERHEAHARRNIEESLRRLGGGEPDE